MVLYKGTLMKIKKIFFFLVLLISLKINAQSSNLLIGKWLFKEVYHKEKIDKDGLESLNTYFINKMAFNFIENGNFQALAMGQKMEGTWVLIDDSKKITLKTDVGESFELIILELSKNRLGLKIGLGEFLMVKN